MSWHCIAQQFCQLNTDLGPGPPLKVFRQNCEAQDLLALKRPRTPKYSAHFRRLRAPDQGSPAAQAVQWPRKEEAKRIVTFFVPTGEWPWWERFGVIAQQAAKAMTDSMYAEAGIEQVERDAVNPRTTAGEWIAYVLSRTGVGADGVTDTLDQPVVASMNVADALATVERQEWAQLLGDEHATMPHQLRKLPELSEVECIYVCEGEKAVEAACALGLVATTSPHGSKSAGKTDWAPLANKEVVSLPDADDEGQRYKDDVITQLAKLTPPPMVKVIDLPDLPRGGDLVDFLDLRGGDAETNRAAIETWAEKAQAVDLANITSATLPTAVARYAPSMTQRRSMA